MDRMEPSSFDAARSGWVNYWHMLWLVAGLSALALPVEHLLGYRSVGLIFLGVLLALSPFFTVGPLVWGALLSAFAWNFFYIPPHFTWAVGHGEDLLLITAYFLSAFIGGALTRKVRSGRLLLEERESHTRLLYDLSDILRGPGSHPERFLSLARHLERRLGFEVSLYLCRPDGTLDPQGFGTQHPHMLPKEEALAVQALKERIPRFDGARLLMPLLSGAEGGAPIGLLACRPLRPGPLGPEQEQLLRTAAQQLALSLEQALMQKDLREADLLKESERLHQALLDGISHELRTPLTVLLGSAAALRGATEGQREALLDEVAASGARLDRSVSNLLDLSRLNAGRLQLKKDWQDPAELLRLSLASLKPLLGQHPVQLEAPEALPLIQVDHRLFEHVLANLLLNAVNHSPAGKAVAVKAFAQGGQLKVQVADQGPGIPAEALPKIFDRFYRASGEREGGTGLGLSIARAIVQAHGGELAAANRLEGGAEFSLSLPIPAQPSVQERPA